MSHRLLDHTADLRAELEASDLAALYDEAVALVRELLVGSSPVVERIARRPETDEETAAASEPEAERFFRFVRELVYLADAERFLPAGVTLDGGVTLFGETFDPQRHASERQIKAVTRHAYRFEKNERGYRVELLFDL